MNVAAARMQATQIEPSRLATPGAGTPISLADALRATLENHPTLKIQNLEVTVGRALRQEASGQFDTVYGSNLARQSLITPLSRVAQSQLPTGLLASDSTQSLATYGFNLSRQFRNGVSVNTFTNINRAADNITNLTAVNTSQSGVQLVLPLMQGRGRDATGAKEKAAALEAGSRELDARLVAEQLLANLEASPVSDAG